MTVIFVFLLSIFSHMIFPGYNVGIQDHKIYIPLIEKIYNPSLFHKDLLMFEDYSFLGYSLYGNLIVFLIKYLHVDIYIVLFFLSIIARFLFCYALYEVVLFFTKDKKFSLAAPIFIISGLTVYGTATITFDSLLLPRTIGLSLSMLFLAFFLKRKVFFSAIILGLAVLFHPTTALIFLLYMYAELFFLWRHKKFKLKQAFFALIPVIFFIAMRHFAPGMNFDYFLKIIPQFEHVLRFGVPYLFITSWNIYSCLWFIPTFVFFFAAAKSNTSNSINIEKRQHISIFLVLPLFLTIFSFVAVDIFKMYFISILQLSRSLIIWKIMSTLFFTYYAYNKLKQNSHDLFFNFILIGMITSLIVKEVVIFAFLPFFLYFLVKRKAYG